MNTALRDALAKAPTKRFDYALHCIDRALQAIMGIPQIQMRSEIHEQVNYHEKQLKQLMRDPRAARVKKRRRRSHIVQSVVGDDVERQHMSPLFGLRLRLYKLYVCKQS